jgi:hypothetical protein
MVRGVDAVFWLIIIVLDIVQCMAVGKKPSIVENEFGLELNIIFRLYVKLLSSL